jgi:hypothetical protein
MPDLGSESLKGEPKHDGSCSALLGARQLQQQSGPFAEVLDLSTHWQVRSDGL